MNNDNNDHKRQITYKSPLKKLVAFFEKSRDTWKAKAIEATYALKLNGNRIRFLESSKAELKQQNQQLKAQLGKLEQELANLKQDQPQDHKKKL